MLQTGLIPIYTTNGDAEAFLLYPYLFNRNGDWIGFITQQKEVYSVLGNYVGSLTSEPRIVSKRTTSTLRPRLKPPPRPQKVYPPAIIPLPPMMAELSHSVIDVLQDAPERLHTTDTGEQRQDMG
ncbi:MAG TPA: hypothetical protein VJL10_11260 [Anaerolineales bacterium]|nr:hypothetical protein [Anaerolineales bacterium]